MPLTNNITPMSDISLSQLPILAKYFNFMDLGTQAGFDSARQLIVTNNLQQSIINADNYNVLITAITSADISKGLEAFILDYLNVNVDLTLATLLTNYQTYIDNLKNSGDWSATVAYSKNNAVHYINNHQYYFAIRDVPIGTLPTDTNFWTNIVIGKTFNFNNINARISDIIYSPLASYGVNDAVTNPEQSTVYISKVANNVGNPLTNANFWERIVGLGDWTPDGKPDADVGLGIPIVDTIPLTAMVGDLFWVKTSQNYVQLQKIDTNGVPQPYDMLACNVANNYAATGGIATALAKTVGFYKGSVVEELNLPIGSIISAQIFTASSNSYPLRNQAMAVTIRSSKYEDRGTVVLAGKWVSRGMFNNPGGVYICALLQRIQ